mmetsp:Transcript_25914/g.66797  ORF Transcript_25914/g.66797 Transcript_25914/m.66797 type:complete len:204 (-) Transcript_25914:1333-1944(-)
MLLRSQGNGTPVCIGGVETRAKSGLLCPLAVTSSGRDSLSDSPELRLVTSALLSQLLACAKVWAGSVYGCAKSNGCLSGCTAWVRPAREGSLCCCWKCCPFLCRLVRTRSCALSSWCSTKYSKPGSRGCTHLRGELQGARASSRCTSELVLELAFMVMNAQSLVWLRARKTAGSASSNTSWPHDLYAWHLQHPRHQDPACCTS